MAKQEGFNLGDAFNRLFNTGEYDDFKPGREKGATDSISRVLENMNFQGKNANEIGAGFMHPLGQDNQTTGKFLDEGDTAGAWTNYNADNPIGRGTAFEKQQQGWSKQDAINAGSNVTGNTAGTVAALIYGAGALGGGGSSAAGGSGATATPAASGGTASGSAAPATSTMDKVMGYVDKFGNLMGGGGGGGGSGEEEESPKKNDSARKMKELAEQQEAMRRTQQAAQQKAAYEQMLQQQPAQQPPQASPRQAAYSNVMKSRV